MTKTATVTRAKSAGFTLLEVIIAIAIFAILSAMAYSGLQKVLGTQQQVDVRADQLRLLQTTFNVFSRDVEQAVARGVRDEYGLFGKPLVGNNFEGYLLELTRGGWRNPASAPRSSLQRVAYDYKDKKLVRLFWYVLDRAEDSKPLSNVLLEDVENLEFRYLDSQGEWHNAWPNDIPGQPTEVMPRAVEINLETKMFGKVTRLFRVPG